jgi:hypothetical protein
MDDTEWLWDYLKHFETTYSSRINFFLVAESMLMVSYATVIVNANYVILKFIALLISILGILYTYYWFKINKKGIYGGKNLMDRFGNMHTPYKEIRDDIRKCHKFSSNKYLQYFAKKSQ